MNFTNILLASLLWTAFPPTISQNDAFPDNTSLAEGATTSVGERTRNETVAGNTEEIIREEDATNTSSPRWTVYPSAVIASVGVVFNLLSLSYFVRRELDCLGSKLLMLLNALDLTVCVIGVIQLITMIFYYKIHPAVHETLGSVNFIFLESTGFATCLLSITRCISLYAPFYKVKGRRVVHAAMVFFCYTFIREATLVRLMPRDMYLHHKLLYFHIGTIMTEIGLMILTVLVANSVCIAKILITPDTPGRSRSVATQATFTVAILSAFFCVLNAFYLVTEVMYFFLGVPLSANNIVLYSGIYYAIPLNSAINPLIYLLRKKEMRKYLRNPLKPPSTSRSHFTMGVPSPSLGTILTKTHSIGTPSSPGSVFSRANSRVSAEVAGQNRLPSFRLGPNDLTKLSVPYSP